MDVLAWLWWLVSGLLGMVWSLAWFLLGGWVSTFAQLGVVALLIFGYKYGWQRAPQELLSRLGAVGRYAWGWVRAREPRPAYREPEPKEGTRAGKQRRGLRQRQPGDIRVNLSTLMTLAMLAGLWMLTGLK